MDRNLYIIAGCNGAGKTTAAYTLLPEILHCKSFVNADEIARGLSPFQPEAVAIEAGRLMLKRIEGLLNNHESFAFETTLASKSYKTALLQAKSKGYRVILLFLWLPTMDLAKERVRNRVTEGGHAIDPEVIERRYARGLKNLLAIYIPLSDVVLVIDNSSDGELIARKINAGPLEIINQLKFNQLKSYYHGHENKR
ncbi:MAG: zeta toxin family protein [Odoribacteraceae bacterium]|jgi:predicted ABC-type ATPase|nr:zeta toxin family protein [Odoribacteraceae bacterium]